MQDRPTPDAILAAVADWLRGTAAATLPPHARFEAKVAAGAVDLVRRQITAQADDRGEAAILSALVGRAGDADALTRDLCADIESGKTDLATPGLADLLIRTTRARIDVDQPEFPAAERLRALAAGGPDAP